MATETAPAQSVTPEASKTPVQAKPQVDPKTPVKAPGKTPDKAALSREMEILKQKNALKAEREALDKDKLALKTKADADPLGVLGDLGIDFNKVALAHMDATQAKNPEIETLKAEIKAVKDDSAKQIQDAEAKRLQEQVQTYVAEVVAGVKAEAPEKYPAIAFFGAYQLVVDEIGNHYNKTQVAINPSEAAKIVNDRITAETDEWLKANPAGMKWLMDKLNPEPPKKEEKPKGVTFKPSKSLAGAPAPDVTPEAPLKPQKSTNQDDAFFKFRKQKYGL